jgi:hypothetical protein
MPGELSSVERSIPAELGPVELSSPEYRGPATLGSQGVKNALQQLSIDWRTAQVEVGARLQRCEEHRTSSFVVSHAHVLAVGTHTNAAICTADGPFRLFAYFVLSHAIVVRHLSPPVQPIAQWRRYAKPRCTPG